MKKSFITLGPVLIFRVYTVTIFLPPQHQLSYLDQWMDQLMICLPCLWNSSIFLLDTFQFVSWHKVPNLVWSWTGKILAHWLTLAITAVKKLYKLDLHYIETFLLSHNIYQDNVILSQISCWVILLGLLTCHLQNCFLKHWLFSNRSTIQYNLFISPPFRSGNFGGITRLAIDRGLEFCQINFDI